MAITRKLLKGMGLTEEQQDTIIEAHTDTVNGLKADIDRYKTDAEKLPAVQKELDGYKQSGGADQYKSKYEAEHKAFEAYKADVTAKQNAQAKETACAALLKEINVNPNRVSSVLKLMGVDGYLDSVELDESGKIKDSDALKGKLQKEYSEYVVTNSTKGANTATPPQNTPGGVKTRAEIAQIKDRAERMAEWAKFVQAEKTTE